MDVWRPLTVGALAAVLIMSAGGCGDEDGDEGGQAPPPVAKPEDFPRAEGRTLAGLLRDLPRGGPLLFPSVSELEPGRSRFGFGLFDRSRAQIAAAPAAIYVAPVGGGQAQGPFPARHESLAVRAQFQSAGVKADPDAARSVYVAELELDRPGDYEVLGVVRLDDRLVAATPAGGPVRVVEDSPVPEVGERAPRTRTPTRTSAGGDLSQIDTRKPHSTMHEEDFAKVLGKKPAVLLFATPALCKSRVCGPVVDVAEQVKAERGGKLAWIHMEIYNENTLEKGFRPQVLEWKLPTEPWLFTVDRRGRVAARIEGAFSARELERAVAAAVKREAAQ